MTILYVCVHIGDNWAWMTFLHIWHLLALETVIFSNFLNCSVPIQIKLNHLGEHYYPALNKQPCDNFCQWFTRKLTNHLNILCLLWANVSFQLNEISAGDTDIYVHIIVCLFIKFQYFLSCLTTSISGSFTIRNSVQLELLNQHCSLQSQPRFGGDSSLVHMPT